jgi:hypothetical protein
MVSFQPISLIKFTIFLIDLFRIPRRCATHAQLSKRSQGENLNSVVVESNHFFVELLRFLKKLIWLRLLEVDV